MDKKILIIIDNQNGFNTNEFTSRISKKIVDLSKSNYFDYIIATQYFNNQESKTNLFIKLQGWFYLLDEKQIEYVEGLKYDFSIKKDVYSAVNVEMIDHLKKVNNGNIPKYVFICGMDTECCVLKTSVDFFELGIVPILLEKYTCSNSGIESHIKGLDIYKRLISPKTLLDHEIKNKQNIDDIIKDVDCIIFQNTQNFKKN